MKIDEGNIAIVPDDKYYRLQFWVNEWKFHTAKMPIEQAKKLVKEISEKE